MREGARSGDGAPAHLIRVGFVVGPTGSGKSALAIEMAQRLGAEIVNADSRQFYRGMDIGTAKPDSAARRRVRHHLIDIRAPSERLDVAEFMGLARAAIAEIDRRGRRAIVVGGSGLYLRVLRHGLCEGEPACPALRAEMAAIARERGVEHLHRLLAQKDPQASARIGSRDLYRITRALEVLEQTGIPLSEYQRRHAFAERPYATLTVGIRMARERLYETIDRRLDGMVAQGMVEEVRALIAAGSDSGGVALGSIGYRQIAAHLRGELDLATALRLARRDTRRLAKRQLTWFRADSEIRWVDADGALEQALALMGPFFKAGRGAADG